MCPSLQLPQPRKTLHDFQRGFGWKWAPDVLRCVERGGGIKACIGTLGALFANLSSPSICASPRLEARDLVFQIFAGIIFDATSVKSAGFAALSEP